MKKPYIGVLVQNGDNKYAIPLTSAKDKHKAWKYVESDRLLVYERIKRKSIRENDIFKEPDQSVKDNEMLFHMQKMVRYRKSWMNCLDDCSTIFSLTMTCACLSCSRVNKGVVLGWINKKCPKY